MMAKELRLRLLCAAASVGSARVWGDSQRIRWTSLLLQSTRTDEERA